MKIFGKSLKITENHRKAMENQETQKHIGKSPKIIEKSPENR